MSKSRSLFSYVSGAAAVLAVLACLIAGYPLVLELRLVFLRLRPTLLSVQRAQAICELLSLSSDDKRCQGKPVYASEFFATFRKRYIPARWSSVNRGYLDKELGVYLTKCDAWYASASDGNFQSCYYDLNGDRANLITVNYRREYGAGEAPLTLSTDRIWSVEDALGLRTVADLGHS